MKNNVKQLQQLILKEKPEVTPSKVKKLSVSKRRRGGLAAEKKEVEVVPKLEVIHVNKLLFQGKLNNYYVLGDLPLDLSSLKITLHIIEPSTGKSERYKLDLYEHTEVKQCVEELVIRFNENDDALTGEFILLTDLIAKHRDTLVEEQQHPQKVSTQAIITPWDANAAMEILKSPKLMEKTYDLLEKAWVKGFFETNRMLFMAMASYKSDSPLHISLIGSSHGIKTILERLSKCMPPEDLLYLDDVSGRSFYHCTNGELMNKILFLPYGLDKKAKRALTLLQQEHALSTATTIKDRLGNMASSMKKIHSHFSSVVNDNGCIGSSPSTLTIRMNDSDVTMKALVYYENVMFSGLFNAEEQEKSASLLHNIIRCIKPIEVINPMAHAIDLPMKNAQFAKINSHYNALVKQVCLYHQFQRKKDYEGRLLVEPQDMWIAGELLLNAIELESEDLAPELRELYNAIKAYVTEKAGDKANEYLFTQREIRNALGLSKNYCFRYMAELHKLEYLERSGYANTGHKYRIGCCEEANNKKREDLKSELHRQINELGVLHKKAS